MPTHAAIWSDHGDNLRPFLHVGPTLRGIGASRPPLSQSSAYEKGSNASWTTPLVLSGSRADSWAYLLSRFTVGLAAKRPLCRHRLRHPTIAFLRNRRRRYEARALSAIADPYHSSSKVSYTSPRSSPTPNGYTYAVTCPNNITATPISAKTLGSRTRTLTRQYTRPTSRPAAIAVNNSSMCKK